MMIGLVIASSIEAAPFLAHHKWRQLSNIPVPSYQSEIGRSKTSVILAISGIGKVSAAVATHLLICSHSVSSIYNLGVCGALKSGTAFEQGNIFRISSAVEGDRKNGPDSSPPEFCHFYPFDTLPDCRLVTVDQPVFNRQCKRELSILGDLVDMEGAAVARVANMYSIPCVLIKGITDSAEEGNRSILMHYIDTVSQDLATLFFETMASSF